MQKQNYRQDILIILIILLLLFSVSLLTMSIGTTDTGDYAGVAKFFAGMLHSNIRSSHSYLYGLLHYPLVLLTQNFFALKLASLLYLALIILSAYFASRRNRKVLFLLLLSPVIWYMGPWISPIAICSLLFFWAYYFMKKYDLAENIKFLIIAGLLVGLAACFWGAVLFFAILLSAAFLCNKKTLHSALFVLFVILGFLPQLFMDQILFGSFAVGILRYFANSFGWIFLGAEAGKLSFDAVYFLPALVIVFAAPFYKLFSKEILKKNKSKAIFILLSLLLILLSYSHIRWLLMVFPILIFETAPLLTRIQLRWHLIASLVLIPLVITPYLIQINHSTNADNFENLVRNTGNIQIDDSEKILHNDLDKISSEFPGQIFVIGNNPDNYMKWFLNYWGRDIRAVSIQDYQLYLDGNQDIFIFTYNPKSNIQNRRELFITGSMRTNSQDTTDHKSIRYALSDKESIDLDGFALKKRYEKLYLFEKS